MNSRQGNLPKMRLKDDFLGILAAKKLDFI
jgi:hypothetical protein